VLIVKDKVVWGKVVQKKEEEVGLGGSMVKREVKATLVRR